MHHTHTMLVGEREVACTIRKVRGCMRITLRVRNDGTLSLSVPWWVSRMGAVRYLTSQEAWIQKTLRAVGGGISPSNLKEVHAKEDAHHKKYKEEARILVHARLAEINKQYGFVWGRVAIRKNATRWGSCSGKRNLNFDYRILFLPPHLQDYLVTHELCHLKEMNHSPRFWALVAIAVPGWRVCRTELKRTSRTLS